MVSRKKWNRETIKFETDLEKAAHKVISSIRFGEKIQIENNDYNWKEFENAYRKSAFYNCIDIHCRWSNDKKILTISCEM